MNTAIAIVIIVALVALLVVMIVRSESRRLRQLRGDTTLDHAVWTAQSGNTRSSGRANTFSTGQWVAFSMLANQTHHHHHHNPDEGQSPSSGILGDDSNYGDALTGTADNDGGSWDGHRNSGLFGDTDIPNGGDTPNGAF
ncbi:hypothetical protein C5E45_19125 [Nocardia nova]|uniref:Uncharacterized protein n=1 Tax=Nocardia nova TaxID=37330 RepID=A0A2S6AMU8_9NOCA|nr:hypothetical protein [Nocardia nova]PPJ36542.1 hypothetical protein C5E45_19125 [Nocardia nova]